MTRTGSEVESYMDSMISWTPNRDARRLVFYFKSPVSLRHVYVASDSELENQSPAIAMCVQNFVRMGLNAKHVRNPEPLAALLVTKGRKCLSESVERFSKGKLKILSIG